jgi:hypothetical protein
MKCGTSGSSGNTGVSGSSSFIRTNELNGGTSEVQEIQS